MWPDSSSLKHLIFLTKIDFPPVHRILCTSFLTLVKNQDSINKANYHEFFYFHPYNSGKTITYLINFLTNTFPSTEEVCYFTASPTSRNRALKRIYTSQGIAVSIGKERVGGKLDTLFEQGNR